MKFFILLALPIFLIGCSVNNNLMLKTGKDFEFDVPPEKPDEEYVISPNDQLTFRLFSNDGFMIVDFSSGNMEAGQVANFNQSTMLRYQVQHDGNVKLPILGVTNLVGKTVREAELFLEDKYADFYVKPYAMLNVVNRRIVVFPGEGSLATVIPMTNENMTLIEVLALAGGITDRGKAHRIKIIRNQNAPTRKVFLVDLSTIDGLREANMVMQANDIVYVEPTRQLAREILAEISPIVSILSSALIVYLSLSNL